MNHKHPLGRHVLALSAWICLAALAVAPGCSSETDDDSKPAADGGAADGSAADGGGVDAGTSSDAGSSTDAGASNDASSSSDAGEGTDAGKTSSDTSAMGGDAGSAGAGSAGADAGSTGPKLPWKDHKLAIAGVWESNFGGNEAIDDAQWVTGFGAGKVVKFDNAKKYLITQNSKDDKYNPSKFNKIVWHNGPGSKDFWQPKTLWYCWVAFGKETADLAEASTATADSSTPDKSGCGKSSWTRLTSIETVGNWKTPFGSETINEQAWGFGWLRLFENKKNWAITQNPADAKYGPSTYNKVVWTEAKDGKWFHCTVDFGLKTLKEAKASAKTADDKDPAKGGCGKFPWTQMTKK